MTTKVVKTSFSIDPNLLENAKIIARLIGYKYSFSAYVSDLIEKDLQCRDRRAEKRGNTKSDL